MEPAVEMVVKNVKSNQILVDLYQMYFVVTLPIASKTEWSQVASSLNTERTEYNFRVMFPKIYW